MDANCVKIIISVNWRGFVAEKNYVFLGFLDDMNLKIGRAHV